MDNVHPHGQSRRQYRFALIAAVLGWLALALQLDLILLARWLNQASLLGGIVKFCSYFTLLTNMLVAIALTCAISPRDSRGHRFFRLPSVCGGIAVSIALVSIAYNVLLRPLWQPHGLDKVADELLHDILPLLFLVYWWLYVPKGWLRFRHLWVWSMYPLGYFAFVLVRGELLGDYLYPFVDVGTLGYPQTFINATGVLAGFWVIALLLLALDRIKGQALTRVEADVLP